MTPPFSFLHLTDQNKIKSAENKLAVDVAMWGGLTPDNVDKEDVLAELLDGGAAGLKVFLIDSGKSLQE